MEAVRSVLGRFVVALERCGDLPVGCRDRPLKVRAIGDGGVDELGNGGEQLLVWPQEGSQHRVRQGIASGLEPLCSSRLARIGGDVVAPRDDRAVEVYRNRSARL